MMTDVWNGCLENDNENSCDSDDQQELEFYLYSLVHHDSSVGEDIAPGREDEISPSEPGNPNGPMKGWRYFNRGSRVKLYQSRNESFSKKLQRLSERYNCNSQRKRGLPLQKKLLWKKPESEAMDHSKTKPSRHSPNVSDARSSLSVTNVTSARSSPNATASNLQGPKILSTPTSAMKNTEADENTSLSATSVSPKIISSPLNCADNNDKEGSNQNKENSGEENAVSPTEENEDLNNTNPSLSSIDDCFELPQTSFSKPKSKSAQNLNDCMTQVLGSMLDEDASRSSIESEKRPIPKPSKNGGSSGWTIGMSWEDMSSKFRFNFEVDSVCGDSVREGSVSSSRGNSPEAPAEVTAEPESPNEVSKYDVSLKMKEAGSDRVTLNEESDSEVESIVEVNLPEKEAPPVVEIMSDSEDIVPAEIVKLDDDPVIIEEDIVILYETPKSSSSCGTSTPNVLTPAMMTPTTREPNDGASSKKKETPRLTPTTREPNAGVSSNQDEPPTKKARRLEEEGKEELANILAQMSSDPKLWRLCQKDVTPRPYRRKLPPCTNCRQRDHLWMLCPEPLKINVCSMCSMPGHPCQRCPKSMCLTCGQKTHVYVRRCHQCSRNHTLCTICKRTGHSAKQCPDLWRRYHLTTSSGPPVAPSHTEVLQSSEMWCCNCAKKGHYSHECPMPCSHINEKIFPHVVCYADPTAGSVGQSQQIPGKSGAQTRKSQRAKPPAVSRNAESVESLPAPRSPAPGPGSVRMEGNSRGGPTSTVLHVDLFNTPEFLNNYAVLLPKIKALDVLPTQSDVLASFLDQQLEKLKKPVLNGTQIKLKFTRLMSLMQYKKKKFKGHVAREAYSIASQLNMTVLGHGKLADSEVHVSELRNQVTALRQKTGKVLKDVKCVINYHFQFIFKGTIRADLKLLVNEYLRKIGYHAI